MTIKTVLAPLYDSALDTGVVDAAAKLAVQFNAHLETLLLRVSVDVASEFISSRIDTKHYRQLLDELAHQIESDERAVKENFEQIISNAQISLSDDPSSKAQPSASWRIETGNPAEVLARCGGAYDLIVAGHPSLSSEKPKSSLFGFGHDRKDDDPFCLFQERVRRKERPASRDAAVPSK